MANFNGRDWTVDDMVPFKYVENWDPFFDDVIAEMDARRNDLGASLVATSATSDVAIGTGTKTLTVASPSTKGFSANMYVVAVDGANSANAMAGLVTSYNATTGALALSIPADGVSGSGTPSSWTISISGKPATGANGAGPNWGGTSAGTANAQTLTPAVALGSLTGNPSYEFIAGYSITGAATLNVSGTGEASLRKADGTAAGNGDVVAGTKYVVTLVSGQWRLAGGGGANLAAIHAALFSI